MKRTLVLSGCIIFALTVWTHELRADMGRIVSTDAQVSETAQKAIILHNGEEEVLILGTDLKSDKKAGMIRFIPFPSEPQVTLAPEMAFDAAQALVKKCALKTMARSKSGTSMGPAVEMTFQQKLGAHDMTVIKINDVAGFKEWVNAFFKKKGLPQKEPYPEVESVVRGYVERGIVYFAFDFVELEGPARSIEPLMYRFKSKELYYPLLTSNTFGGEGAINLIIVCPRTIGTNFEGRYPGLPVTETSTSAKVSAGDLKEILPDAVAFFKDQPRLYLQLINYFGPYSFQEDFTADIAQGVDYEVYFEEYTSFLDDVYGDLMNRLPEDMPVMGVEFVSFACPGNFFTVEAPKGWTRTDNAASAEEKNTQGFLLRGPDDNQKVPLTVSLTYYGPGNGTYASPEAYIEKNKGIDSGAKPLGDHPFELKTFAVKGRKTYQFEKRMLLSWGPDAATPKKDVAYLERIVVVPMRKGFAVLRYTAPMTLSDANMNLFKKMVESFAPND